MQTLNESLASERKRNRRRDAAANRAGMVVETSTGVPMVRLP